MLTVFDIAGSQVKKIFEGNLTGGHHRMIWDGRDQRDLPVSTGIYFYRISTETGFLVKKMTLMK